MKNIQIVDGAINADYAIFAASDADFSTLFPQPGQDIELVEDFITRMSERESNRILTTLWTAPIDKKSVCGIHGTLFFNVPQNHDHFPPTRREADWQAHTIELRRNS